LHPSCWHVIGANIAITQPVLDFDQSHWNFVACAFVVNDGRIAAALDAKAEADAGGEDDAVCFVDDDDAAVRVVVVDVRVAAADLVPLFRAVVNDDGRIAAASGAEAEAEADAGGDNDAVCVVDDEDAAV